MTRFAVIIGKKISWLSQLMGLGAGATWPGEIALRLQPSILRSLSSGLRCGVILVAGTNGKTTTSLMIKTILEHEGQNVVHNGSGANLINGIVSAFIKNASWLGTIQADWGVFEVDENSLPIVLSSVKPKVVVLLNLFRDQLDRYGEVDVIAEKWEKALRRLVPSGQAQRSDSTLILNADDPLIAHLGKAIHSKPDNKSNIVYFGVNEPELFLKKMDHATDSIFCLNCGGRLTYKGLYYSHIGIWHCEKCGEKRPEPSVTAWKAPLPGLYNLYNTLAAVATAKKLQIAIGSIQKALLGFTPAFGRQEEFKFRGVRIKIYLSKNPAGFNASLRTVLELKPKALLLLLNDRIPDGRDVSWIWDVDFEMIPNDIKIIVGGGRTYDMALRIKYAEIKNLVVEPDLSKAIEAGIASSKNGNTLYVLPTYSAMLEVRKILSGRKIL